jgi:hypothetical protein
VSARATRPAGASPLVAVVGRRLSPRANCRSRASSTIDGRLGSAALHRRRCPRPRARFARVPANDANVSFTSIRPRAVALSGVLAWPAGRVIVVVAALIIISVGVAHVVKGVKIPSLRRSTPPRCPRRPPGRGATGPDRIHRQGDGPGPGRGPAQLRDADLRPAEGARAGRRVADDPGAAGRQVICSPRWRSDSRPSACSRSSSRDTAGCDPRRCGRARSPSCNRKGRSAIHAHHPPHRARAAPPAGRRLRLQPLRATRHLVSSLVAPPLRWAARTAPGPERSRNRRRERRLSRRPDNGELRFGGRAHDGLLLRRGRATTERLAAPGWTVCALAPRPAARWL